MNKVIPLYTDKIDRSTAQTYRSKLVFQIINQTLKGVYAGMGAGSGPTYEVIPINVMLNVKSGVREMFKGVLEALSRVNVENGDILVVASKPLALAQGRVIDVTSLRSTQDPLYMSKSNRKKLALKLSRKLGIYIDEADLLGIDMISIKGKILGILLPDNPNLYAYKLSRYIRNKLRVLIDVVIADTDAGWNTGIEFIGIPTLVSTPIGATRGLSIAHAIRAAAAASYFMNSRKNVPIVLIKPQPGPRAEMFRKRFGVGMKRPYSGRINGKREKLFRQV